MRSKAWAKLGDDAKRDFLDAELKKARTAVRLAFVPYLANGNRRDVVRWVQEAEPQLVGGEQGVQLPGWEIPEVDLTDVVANGQQPAIRGKRYRPDARCRRNLQ